MTMTHRSANLLLVVACVACGCGHVQRPYPVPSSHRLLSSVTQRARVVQTLRAEARVEYKSQQGHAKATMGVLAGTAGRLRMDLFTPFDTPLATMVSDGVTFVFIDAQQHRYLTGPATPCNLSRLTHVAMSAQDLTQVLIGATPLIAYEKAVVRWDEKIGAETLELYGRQRFQKIILDASIRDGKPSWDLLRSEIWHTSGQLMVRIASANYQPKQLTPHTTIWVPTVLEVVQPSRQTTLKVQFRQQELNATLSPQSFVLPDRTGFSPEMVTGDCGGSN